MTICELEIDFPEIEGVSSRQEWYANNLREDYVSENIDRFQSIEESLLKSLDERKCEYTNGDSSFSVRFNDREMVCLFSTDARVVIGMLKDFRREEDL